MKHLEKTLTAFQPYIPAKDPASINVNRNDFFSFKVSRQVKAELQESQFFHVVSPKNAGRKVAPGMSVVYTVCFTPQENKVLEDLAARLTIRI